MEEAILAPFPVYKYNFQESGEKKREGKRGGAYPKIGKCSCTLGAVSRSFTERVRLSTFYPLKKKR